VDLALAAVLAEPTLSPVFQMPLGVRMAPEALVPRLGDYLIEKGLLSASDLKQALEYQRECAAAGRQILIGQALIDLGLIDRPDVDEAITEQILQLQLALQQTNRQLEQRVAERTAELQQALNRLTELNQLKSNFISNISHELRTPLTHIKGYLDILSDQSLGSLTPPQQDALEVLKRAETRLEKLIDDLIQFSLASKGELAIQWHNIDMRKTIDAVVVQSMHKAKGKQISLTREIQANLPCVKGDEEKISWVVNQLIDNAIKFTPEGGSVTVNALSDGKIVAISVKDNGIGIPPERIDEIFEPFHQLDSSVTRKYAGTGLGLTMVKRILDSHGSRIRIESIPGKGSYFEFLLSAA
jgi:signal transduction histidine kinase